MGAALSFAGPTLDPRHVTRFIHVSTTVEPRDAPAVVSGSDRGAFQVFERLAAGGHPFGPSLVHGVRPDQLIEHPTVGSLAGGHRQDATRTC